MPQMTNQEDSGRRSFRTTQWSVILRLHGSNTPEAQSAWNDLATNYWFPLYAYCRRRGNDEEDARDLTQGFFVHLMTGQRFDSVAPEKGRFRTFMLVAFKNFVANQHRYANTQIRGGGKLVVSIDAVDATVRYQNSKRAAESPEAAFEREWARTVLDNVKKKLASDYERADKSKLFAVLKSQLVPESQSISREEMSQQLGLSQAAVNMSIMRMRRRFREILIEEVSATLDDPSEVEDELRSLMTALSMPT